jgi:bilirubin oxidase
MKHLFILTLLAFTVNVHAQNQLIIPSTIEDTNITLTLQNGTHQFFSGQNTSTMGANGAILGPTLIINNGDNLNINITNNLGQPTTIHWHGMHVSAENDGGPHTIIDPGTTWNPQMTVLDKAATYWYHPHLDLFTDEHASKGIAGFIIVRDAEEAALNLPRTYGVDDIPLAIQTKDFDANYQIVHHSNADDVLMVNATLDPETDLPAQIVRLRLLNGSSQRVFNIGLSGNQTFYQIATDGGLIEAPLALTRVQLAPGERTEILLDLNGKSGQTIQLMSYASEFPNGYYGATSPGMSQNMVLNNYNPNAINGADFNIMQINVVGQTANPVTTIPNSLVTLTPYLEVDANDSRTLTFSSVSGGRNQLNGNFTINGVSFDMNTINITIPLNNIEVWTIQNNSPIAHPFHIHDVQFYILDINGNPPPASAAGLKDTYLIPPGQNTMRFITQFADFANDTVPYMYHCHMLVHEDGGMMGSFVVVAPPLGITDLEKNVDGFTLFPNPSTGVYMTAQLHDKSDQITAYAIVNSLGQIVSYHKIDKNEISNMYSFPVFEYNNGTYFIKLYTKNGTFSKKFIVR